MAQTTEALGRCISMLHRYGQIFIANELEPYHIGRGQFLFLVELLKRDGVLQEELSQLLNIDKATTTRALRKLEEEGYVIRRTREEDRRSNRVYLTDKGRALEPVINRAMQNWTDIVGSDFSEQERNAVLSLLEKMAGNAASFIDQKRSEK